MLSICTCILTISLLYPLETWRGPLIEYNGSLDQGSSKESILVEINRVLLEKMKTRKVYNDNDDDRQRTQFDKKKSHTRSFYVS